MDFRLFNLPKKSSCSIGIKACLSAARLPKHQRRQEAPIWAESSTRQKVNKDNGIFFIKNYPFIPDIVIPSVKYFLKKKKRANIGTVRRVAPAVRMPG